MGRFYALLLALAVVAYFGCGGGGAPKKTSSKSTGEAKMAMAVKVSKQSKACVDCHGKDDPGIVNEWKKSEHAKQGIGCYECHKANKGEPDAFEHYGAVIATIVSPKDCGQCHPKEMKEMMHSYHARANKFVGSLDNVLGRLVTGEANFVLGCAQCHGANLKVKGNGKLTVASWPNHGIGRVNPDGTLGACSSCHERHRFSLEQVREAETCGKCHQGPDHPQMEIWELSKHGIAWKAYSKEIPLNKNGLTLGRDYAQAPTCVTCHMGPVEYYENGSKKVLPGTHNVGARIMWTLRPKVSQILKPEPGDGLPDGRERRKDMKKVCSVCHQKQYIENFFQQFDNYVELYNEKFGKPALAIIKWLKKNGALDPTPFNEFAEWDFWDLWHHAGRRGRHGAAMNGADWSHWHGLYDVAYDFYFKLIPHGRQAAKKVGKEKEFNEFVNEILNRPEHKWFFGLPKEEREKIAEYYRKRYGEK
jgi:hypothetical protein